MKLKVPATPSRVLIALAGSLFHKFSFCMDCLLVPPSYWVNEVRQTEIHTAEPPVPDPSVFEVEVSIEKLKSHKSSSID